ncbi:MAG: sulfite exporter TauE/SafE family protein [Actinomycetota bacterium]|nr:sulfite exporter TauE/SafE family protein [Actinomycetota bacterium]
MTLVEISLVLVAVVAGSLVQGTIGFGLALVVVPVIGLIEPALLPATMLILSFPLTLWMALNERTAVDLRGVAHMIPARIVGTGAGAWVVGVASLDELSIVIGVTIVIAVLISGLTPDFELGIRSRVTAGVMSGFMGTAAGIGGPPLAIAYQRKSGPELRSTLAATFVIGTLISLAALAIAGETEAVHLTTALQLLPGLIVGLALSTRLRGRLGATWLRPAVLTFAGLSGLAAIVKGLT